MTSFLVSLPTLAAQMEVDVSCLLRFIRDGICPAPVLVGGHARFNVGELELWRSVGCPVVEPAGHRTMHAIRRALMSEQDEKFAPVLQRVSDLLDHASPETLRSIQVYL